MTGSHQKKRPNAEERRAGLVEQGVMTAEEAARLSFADERAMGRPIENSVGVMTIPVGMAEHFVVNGRSIVGVPMATEEASIVAAASKAAKLAKLCGGFTTSNPPHAIARGHVLYSFDGADAALHAWSTLTQNHERYAEELRKHDSLAKRGGGLICISVERPATTQRGIVIVRMSINPVEAMGANAVTRLGQRLAEIIKATTDLAACGVICTNHQSGWEVTARASWPIREIGIERGRRLLDWQSFAKVDIDRAVTHNKGIMNGITAVALATAQDTRAIEACAHASALVSGRYLPLTTYTMDEATQTIHGELCVTLSVATKGGKTNHPQAEIYRKIMGATTAKELACIMAAVGLAQNFGALYCLAGEGIPAAHAVLTKAE